MMGSYTSVKQSHVHITGRSERHESCNSEAVGIDEDAKLPQGPRQVRLHLSVYLDESPTPLHAHCAFQTQAGTHLEDL